MNMKISCCMIVKNEENVLDETLKAASLIFDELVIVDTGSIDGTRDIAKKYTDKIFEYPWKDDFADARNFSILKASNDYVFILDADEKIEVFDRKLVEAEFSEESLIGTVKRRNMMENGQVYVEYIKRLFSRNWYTYRGIIHEQIVPLRKFEQRVVRLAVSMDHIGYLNEVLKRTNKVDRNISLLNNAIETDNGDPYLFYQLGKSYELKKDLAEAKKCFEKAISLVKEFRYQYVTDLITSYGYALINLNQYEKAMELEKYEKYLGNIVDYCFMMAHAYMNSGYFDKALDSFESCIGRKEGGIEGMNSFLPAYNIGVIFECLGYIDEAIKWYSSCSGYTVATARLEKLRAK